MKKHIDEETGANFTYESIKKIPICPELMALKPFIIPIKGFSYDEVLSMIQGVINLKSKQG